MEPLYLNGPDDIMYEQVSHSLLNKILDELKPDIRKRDLRNFYTRLGANFYAMHSLFHHLYGDRDDFEKHMNNRSKSW